MTNQSVIMTKEQQDNLAIKLATGLFNCNSQQIHPTSRIQFMSGEWNNEQAEGGLCFAALVSVFQSLLQQYACSENNIYDFVMQLLTFIADEELHELIWWRTDGEYAPITFWTNSNDLLAWGWSDAEEVNADTLTLLKQAVADCKAIDPVCGAIAGCKLFVCRLNKTRPQGAAYPKNRELWPLFDACGPEREIGFVNPYRPGHTQLKKQTLRNTTTAIVSLVSAIVVLLFILFGPMLADQTAIFTIFLLVVFTCIFLTSVGASSISDG